MARPGRQVVAWSVVAAAFLVAAVTVAVRTDGVPTAVAVSYGAQALTGPLFALVGAVVLARRPRHRMGWLCLGLGLVSVTDEFLRAVLTRRAMPVEEPWEVATVLAADVFGILAFSTVTMLLPLLFPDGDVPGPRWRWVLRGALLLIGASVVTVVLADGPSTIWVGDVEVVAFLDNPIGVSPFGLDLAAIADGIAVLAAVWFLAGIAATVVRFRRDPVTRRQILWFAFGIVAAISTVMLTAVPGVQAVTDVLASLAFAWIPVSIGIAITRYRLYEIDRILSRTVAYLVLSGLLVGVYLGSVLALGGLARSVTAASDDLVVAVSTLLVAALFQPLRRRVQRAVDHRFNRARYDAERTLSALGSRLRDEVDLGMVTAELRSAVTETLQPASSSVWLRADTV